MNGKRILLIASISSALFYLSGCSNKKGCINASDKRAEKTLNLESFQSIETNAPIKLHLKQDQKHAVTIKASDNIIPYMEASVKENKLRLVLNKEVCRQGNIEVFVSANKFESIVAAGKVDILTDGTLHSDSLKVELSGSNILSLNLNVQQLNTTSDGASKIILEGQIKRHSIKISGTGLVTDHSK